MDNTPSPGAKPGPALTDNGSKHYEAVICADCHLPLRVAETEDGKRLWVEPCSACREEACQNGYEEGFESGEAGF